MTGRIDARGVPVTQPFFGVREPGSSAAPFAYSPCITHTSPQSSYAEEVNDGVIPRELSLKQRPVS
jgi:hypothetical protein